MTLGVTPDAVLAAVVAVTLALSLALWKLAGMLSAIQSGFEDFKETLLVNREAILRIEDRVTEHRRRNEAIIAALRDHIEQRLNSLSEPHVNEQAIRKILDEISTKRREQEGQL